MRGWMGLVRSKRDESPCYAPLSVQEVDHRGSRERRDSAAGRTCAETLLAAQRTCPLSPNRGHCHETRGKHAVLSSNLGQNRGQPTSRPSGVDAAMADCPRLDENPCVVDSQRNWGTAGQTVQHAPDSVTTDSTQRKLGHALVEGMLCFADLRVHWHLHAHRLITGVGPNRGGL